MKKILIISSLISLLISSSCKKNYSCACTTKLTQNGLLPYQTATVQDVKKNTSKKKAAKICENTAKQMLIQRLKQAVLFKKVIKQIIYKNKVLTQKSMCIKPFY
jgi:hypothetical protein